eukprot:360740-Chlamydomonas_euryale.AAC.10
MEQGRGRARGCAGARRSERMWPHILGFTAHVLRLAGVAAGPPRAALSHFNNPRRIFHILQLLAALAGALPPALQVLSTQPAGPDPPASGRRAPTEGCQGRAPRR